MCMTCSHPALPVTAAHVGRCLQLLAIGNKACVAYRAIHWRPLQVYSQLEGDTSHVVNTAWALLTLVRGGCSDQTVSRSTAAARVATLR